MLLTTHSLYINPVIKKAIC